MKKFFIIFGILIVGAIIFVMTMPKSNSRITLINTQNTDVKNIAYTIDGEILNLGNGLTIFGEPKYSDLDSDGDEDAAILLVHDPGGSGTFYYAALAINNAGSYTATNAVFLGDRIAPQTVDILYGSAVYNIMERQTDEPLTAQPSVGRSVWIYYDKATSQIRELFSPGYISAQSWPPEIDITSDPYICDAGKTERQINNHTYCLSSTSEGAAGSTYIDYDYTTTRENKLINLQFVLRYPQCQNYDQPQQGDCQAAQAGLDLDQVVDNIVQNI